MKKSTSTSLESYPAALELLQQKLEGASKASSPSGSSHSRGFTYSANKEKCRKNGGVDEPKGWQISKMWERHHEIARRVLLGQKNIDIARDLGINKQTVSNVKNSPIVKEKLYLMQAARDVGSIDLAREIRDLAPLALERIREALTSGKVLGRELSAAGILKESGGILDRELGKPTQRVDSRTLHAHLTVEDIEKIKSRAKELALSSNLMGSVDG